MVTSPEPETPKRRARSASPSKANRYELQLGAQSLRSFDDLVSTNGSIFDRSQLKKLARSPLSKKLHVSSGPLSNPIPFQLQLPPRLSKSVPNSPDGKQIERFPRKMIFNGQTYEPYYSDDLALDEDEFLAVLSVLSENIKVLPANPEKPPSLGNRKKIARFAEKNNTHLSKQLSMIRERSLRITSSKASSPQKELPPSPPLKEPSLPRRLALENLSAQTTPKSTIPASRSQPLLAPIAKLLSPSNAMKHLNMAMDSIPSSIKSLQNTPESVLPRKDPADSVESRLSNNSEPSHSPQVFRIPNSTAFHHNLFLGEAAPFKVDKRTFSDESTVSSISSFSSIGEAFAKSCAPIGNLSMTYQPRNKGTHPPSRFSNETSESYEMKEKGLEMPNKSLNSLQFTNGTSPNRTADNSELSENPEQLPTSHLSTTIAQEVLPLVSEAQVGSESQKTLDIVQKAAAKKELDAFSLGRKNQSLEDSIQKQKPTEECEVVIANDPLDDNCGMGMNFNFPNDSLNMTNADDAKKKAQKARSPRRKSILGHMTPQGQIEIPRLPEESPLKNKSGSCPLDLSNRMEFIQSAKNESFDTDSDSSFNSQFSNLQAKQLQSKSIPFSKSLNAIPAPVMSSTSPIRHSRQRSMFSINMEELEQDVSPLKTKCFGQSELGPGFQPHRSPPKSTLMRSYDSPNKEISDGKSDHDLGTSLNINEPPKKIQYAVDFKSAKPVAKPFQRHGYSHSYSSRISQLANSPQLIPSYYNQAASETNSSYKSSRTGVGTASTAPSETESVTIDLTKEKYDVCLVKRHDSTLSYKSVIENTKDGEKIEVVLVDDDDENSHDRDDLLSIYSRYMGDWNRYGSLRKNLSTKETIRLIQRLRESSLSTASEESDCSENSWAAGSTTNFSLKPSLSQPKSSKKSVPFLKELSVPTHRKGIPPRRKAPEVSEWQDIEDVTCQIVSKMSIDDLKYFDYSQGAKYDFNSYMKLGINRT